MPLAAPVMIATGVSLLIVLVFACHEG